MVKKSDNILIRATRSQLYSMAATATFGEGTELIIDHKSYEGSHIRCAVEMRDTAPDQRKKDAHKNGYAYYQIDRAGVIKPLTEDEV
jgi:hypothetical protein